MVPRKLIWTVAIIGVVSLILGVLMVLGIPKFLFGLTPSAYLRFTNTCLLFAIFFVVINLLGKKSG